VQTAAFPLAVSLLGQRGGWLSHEEARIYVTRVVDILLNRQRPGADVVGLLGELGERYKEKDQYEVFLQVVGDGTLWIALLAILAQLKWEEGFERFERAINLYRVYSCDLLRSDTSVGKLGSLVTRIQVEKARELIASEAPRIAGEIEEVVGVLDEHFQELLKAQNSATHINGDLIWNQNAGWGVVKDADLTPTHMVVYLHLRGADVTVVTRGFYINLRIASEAYPSISRIMNFL
jgi:hypothetical protein